MPCGTTVTLWWSGRNALPKGPLKNAAAETALVVHWLRFCAANAGDSGLIPGQGTKIPHALRRGQKMKKKIKVLLLLCVCVCVLEFSAVALPASTYSSLSP